jgi:hypothetical protein
MKKDNTVGIKKPESFIDDPLTEILRQALCANVSETLPPFEFRVYD